jgi:RNA polymerase sigma-70 factor (ECF subfamily)
MIENPDDVSKFDEIYRKYRGTVYSVAYSILHDNHHAEDAAQEVFFKVARNISKIDEISAKKTKAFLVTLSKTTSIDLLRKNRHERNKVDWGEENDMDDIESAVTPDLLNELISDEGYRRIKTLISEMGDTYKDAMRLRFILEWSNSEIAEHLGVSKNVVEFRISRGRAMLIQMLKKEGYYADR